MRCQPFAVGIVGNIPRYYEIKEYRNLTYENNNKGNGNAMKIKTKDLMEKLTQDFKLIVECALKKLNKL